MQNLSKYLKPQASGEAANTNIAHTILINAPEDYSAISYYYLEQLRHQIGQAQYQKFNADRYFKHAVISELINKRSLFDDKIYIEIHYKSKPNAEQQKELLALLTQLDETIYLVIVTDKLNKADLNSAWVKAINELGAAFTLLPSDIADAVQHHMQQYNQTISNDGLDLLIELNQGNLSQLMQEIKQLTLAYPENHSFSIDDIKRQSTNNSIYSIYQLSNAYLSGSLQQSIMIMSNLYQKAEDAILLQWIINEDIKKIIRIKAKLKQHQNMSQILQDLKIWTTHTDLYKTAERRLNYNILINTLDNLAKLDMTIKGIITTPDIKQQLMRILQNICAA